MTKSRRFLTLSLSVAVTTAAILIPVLSTSLSNNAYAAAMPTGSVQYNIRQSSLFDKNNVALAINDTVAKMKVGDKLYLQGGDYKFKETIKITDGIPIVGTDSTLTDCEFVLEGNYTMDGAFDAMVIDGDNIVVRAGNFKSDKTDYKTENALPGGITIRESNYSTYNFGDISGFDCGLKFAPTELMTGICYSYVTFRSISNCYSGIRFHGGNLAEDKRSSWVNENYIYGGTISNCYDGFHAKKGDAQVDEYNNNSFYKIAFSDIAHDAIVCEFSSFNQFYRPVFKNIERYYVNQKTTSKANKFYFSENIPDSKLSLYGKGDILEGNITDDNGEIFAKRIVMTNNRQVSGTKRVYEYLNMKTVDARNESVTLPINTSVVNVSSSTAAVKITVPMAASYNGYTFVLNVESVNQPIIVVDGYGYEFFEGKIKSPGKYQVTNIDNKFEAIKLS
ncbi:MAG: hypothetical protein RR177_04190 [Oscillospiraceae bacterium]